MTEKPTTPRLVIVGRPNVGKSTLFNRLLGRRRALVHDLPGVTRDRLEERTTWRVAGRNLPVVLVDTGGLGGESFSEEIAHQVQIALKDADIVLVLFDARSGLTPMDQDVIRQLNQSGLLSRKGRPAAIIGVVNKVDAESHESLLSDFYATGLDPLISVSAEHGRGIDDLQRDVLRLLEDKLGFELQEEEDKTAEKELEVTKTPEVPKIAIVGRPNVGKSTLVNALTGSERMITSPVAGTTVDAVDSPAMLSGKPFVLIDTAGIRRKSKTKQGVEVLSVVQAKKALERCDVAVLLLDGETGITEQDEKIGGLIEEVGCGVVLLVNKWDTQRRNVKFTKAKAAEQIRKRMAYLNYAPIMFGSAAKGAGFDDLGDLIEEILRQRQVKISTHEFTEWVRQEAEVHNPTNAKFYLCHQTGRNPPTFVCHVNDTEKIHFSLKRHLINAIRERWGYMGNPIRLLFVKGASKRKAPR